MRLSFSYLFLLPVFWLQARDAFPGPSPLAAYSPAWNEAKYLRCNTAANASYLSEDEKKVIYIINLLRANPTLFAATVLKKYPALTGFSGEAVSAYYRSLVDTVSRMKPMPILKPDSLCFASARCHAASSGKVGYVGHDRQSQECRDQEYYDGECCHYGFSDPLDIVMSLLIDENVPSLGHRYAILGNYVKLGVSIQPHTTYRFNAVLDFKY